MGWGGGLPTPPWSEIGGGGILAHRSPALGKQYHPRGARTISLSVRRRQQQVELADAVARGWFLQNCSLVAPPTAQPERDVSVPRVCVELCVFVSAEAARTPSSSEWLCLCRTSERCWLFLCTDCVIPEFMGCSRVN